MARRSSARIGRQRSARTRAEEHTTAVPDDPREKARQICLRLLTAKARTKAELASALARRGIDEDIAQEVLARFSEVGLIDDAAFAENLVHSGHTYRGLGRRALAAELHRRGVDEQTTSQAISAVDSAAEEETARTLVRRRLATATPTADEVATIRSLVGVLARRGYPEGLSYRVVRDELRAAGWSTELLDDADADGLNND
jgi:regulatory protein